MKLQQFKEQKYRYVIFTIYILAALVNSIPVNTFSPINSTVEKVFEISILEVSINAIIFPICHVLFSLPCNLLINKKGVRVSFVVGAVLMIGGMWLRTFLSVGEPYLCILGSLLTAIGGIFVLNTPSRIALYWFKSQKVPYVIFVGTLVNIISMALGLTIPGYFLSSSSSSDQIINFLKYQAYAVTIPFILLAIFIREKPTKLPSTAAQMIDKQKKDYKSIMKALFTNTEYIKLALVMALNFGVCIAFFAILEQVITTLGYTNSAQVISTMGTSGTLAGVVGNIVYSLILRKTKKYKFVLIVASGLFFIGFGIIVFGFLEMTVNTFAIIGVAVIFCTSYFSLPSICILFSTQLAFPIDQASAAGYILAFSQTVGFLCGLLFTNMLDGTKFRAQLIFAIVGLCILISAILSFFIKQNLFKTEYQKNQYSQKESLLDSIIGQQ